VYLLLSSVGIRADTPFFPIPAALLSRQFCEAGRLRVEGLLAAFPKLVSDSASGSKQHTYVETDTVR
jgi:hypothetical protein